MCLRDDNPCQLHSSGKMTMKPDTAPIDSNMVDEHGKKYLILKHVQIKFQPGSKQGCKGQCYTHTLGRYALIGLSYPTLKSAAQCVRIT